MSTGSSRRIADANGRGTGRHGGSRLLKSVRRENLLMGVEDKNRRVKRARCRRQARLVSHVLLDYW